ncbi:MAG: carboxypeptidase regulatory-like domain-containing protein [Gemmatimonadota bacterium]|nr:carboxypeptidase regulatory-like domain-containing protein [Gemmatimonadota bacterium]
MALNRHVRGTRVTSFSFGRKERLLAAGFAVASVLLAGCHTPTATCAPYEIVGVISVAVRDASTGQPIATSALLTAKEHFGSAVVADTARPSQDGLYLAIGTQAATYDLTVTEPGYATWTDAGVTVVNKPHSCQPELVSLSANLVPF